MMTVTRSIVPHIWLEKDAEKAAAAVIPPIEGLRREMNENYKYISLFWNATVDQSA